MKIKSRCSWSDAYDIIIYNHLNNERHANYLDTLIAKDSISFDEYNEALKWELYEYLFKKLVDNPAMRDSDSTMYNFYEDKLGTSIGQFAEVANNTDELYDVNQALQDDINAKQDGILQDMGEMEFYQQIIDADTSTEADKAQLDVDIEIVSQDIAWLTSYINTAIDQIANDRMLKAEIIRQLNLGITTTYTIEENAKEINDIYLSTIAKGIDEFSSNEVNSIYGIAIQCPISGGKAVYKARSMYSLIDPLKQYDDAYTCLLGGIQLRRGKTEQRQFVASVYPNPAKNMATITYNVVQDAIFEIYNSFGQLQNVYKLQSKAHEYVFDTDKLNNGVYIFKVVCCGENINTGKLVITK